MYFKWMGNVFPQAITMTTDVMWDKMVDEYSNAILIAVHMDKNP